MTPIRFAFGLHLHQPVGNFDHVFAQHVDDVYRPVLDALADREFLPAIFHLSGPLLEWLEQHEPAYLDRLGRLAADGQIELLLAQSSDWQFIISTGAAADYGERRFREHCSDTEDLLQALEDRSAAALDRGHRRAAELAERDALFPDVLPALAAVLAGSRSLVVG